MPLRIRIYQMVCLVVAVLCLLVVEPSNQFQNLPLAVHLCTVILGIVSGLFYWESRRGRHRMGLLVFSIVLILDIMWFWNAGSQGSVTYFFFPLLLLSMSLFQGRLQRFVALGLLLNVVALLVLELLFPGLVTPFKAPMDRFIDHVTGLAASILVSAVVTWLILLSHDREKRGITELASKLAASEQIYREIFNATSDALMIYDAEGRLIDFNDQACVIFGFDRETGLRLSIDDRSEGVPPYSSVEVRERFSLVMAGRPQLFEWRSRRQNGQLFWSEVAMRACEIAGQPRVIGSFRDISDRKQQEEQLRLNEERLRLSMLVSSQGWFELNVQSGVGQSSPEYLRIIGEDPATYQTTLQSWIESIHPDDTENVMQIFRECVASGGTRATEYRRRLRSGGWKWIRSVGKIVAFDAQGRPLRMCGTHADITERKELEQRLLHSQRLEAVGRLASGVAHDLNNILTPLLMVTSLFRDRLTSPEDRDLMTLLETGGRRGAAIVKQLLAFSQNLPEHRLPVQPLTLVREVAQLLRATLPATIQVVQPEGDSPRTVLAEPNQLHQVLMNLCLNARDAMPDGGVLTLGLEWQEAPVEGANPGDASLGGPYAILSVRDTGHGIRQEDLQRIFDPFFTTKELGKGTGLGLASVYGIVKAHGGLVRVESHEGQGTVFRVFLPANGETVRGGPSAPGLDPGAPGGAPALPGEGEGILVVDDEPGVRVVTARILKRAGYRVLEADSGPEALRLLGRHRESIHIVITDFSMPGMDGPTLVPLLHRLSPRLRIIGVSGNDQNGRAAELEQLGFAEILGKPYPSPDLVAAVRRQLALVPG